jgi:hypothetical protein
LIPSLVKCLLFHLDSSITHENGEHFSLFFWLLQIQCDRIDLLCQKPLSFHPLKTSNNHIIMQWRVRSWKWVCVSCQ